MQMTKQYCCLTLMLQLWEVNHPQTDLFAVISEPFGVKTGTPQVMTFLEYDGATKWHIFRNHSPTRNSKWRPPKGDKYNPHS